MRFMCCVSAAHSSRRRRALSPSDSLCAWQRTPAFFSKRAHRAGEGSRASRNCLRVKPHKIGNSAAPPNREISPRAALQAAGLDLMRYSGADDDRTSETMIWEARGGLFNRTLVHRVPPGERLHQAEWINLTCEMVLYLYTRYFRLPWLLSVPMPDENWLLWRGGLVQSIIARMLDASIAVERESIYMAVTRKAGCAKMQASVWSMQC
eukprot:IDg13355t1